MQTFIQTIKGFVLISLLFTAACNEALKTDKNEADTLTTALSKGDSVVYDPAKDPMAVAAAFTKKLADTLGIRIYEVTLNPGDSMPFHSHPDHALFLLDTSTVVLYVPGKTKGDTLTDGKPGMGWIHGPFNDAVKNIGKTPMRWLEVAVHRPRAIELPAKPAYDSATDAFITGGEYIIRLADTLGMKMFVATMKPGDTATMHSHPDHTVYVLEGGELAVTFQGQPRQIMNLQKGMAFVAGPLSDAAKNTGKTTVKLLMTHIYRQRK